MEHIGSLLYHAIPIQYADLMQLQKVTKLALISYQRVSVTGAICNEGY